MTGFYKEYGDPNVEYRSSAEVSAENAKTSELNAKTSETNAASSASSASSSASTATASASVAMQSAVTANTAASTASQKADSILNLTAATGAPNTEASYNSTTGVLTVPRGESSTDLTPLSLREKLKEADGQGSELDADKLDGNDSNYFLNTGSPIQGGFFG